MFCPNGIKTDRPLLVNSAIATDSPIFPIALVFLYVISLLINVLPPYTFN